MVYSEVVDDGDGEMVDMDKNVERGEGVQAFSSRGIMARGGHPSSSHKLDCATTTLA